MRYKHGSNALTGSICGCCREKETAAHANVRCPMEPSSAWAENDVYAVVIHLRQPIPLHVGSRLGHDDVTALVDEGRMGPFESAKDRGTDWQGVNALACDRQTFVRCIMKANHDAGFTLIE